MTLPERLANRAAATPDAVALVAGERRVTYRALQSQVGSLAARMRAVGVTPGDRVSVFGENSPEAVAATYAILSVGAVLVALNTQARSPELAALVAHAGARLLWLQESHAEARSLRSALSPDVVVWGLEPSDPAHEASSALAPPHLDHPAALAYTSGTTGAPKGVLLSHRNLAANTDAILHSLRLASTDRTLCLLPFYYAYGASVLHTHLSTGATLVLENSLAYPAKVLERARAEGVTVLPGVPSTFALLLRRDLLRTETLPTLRMITQAGGAMPQSLVDALRACLPDARLHLMYGQTEATARLTILPPEHLDEKRGSCGRAVPGVELEIVHPETGARLPAGEQGVVRARGPNVMLGYWRDDRATAEVLRDGFLHTGDLGHLDAEGFLFLMGRRADLIKTGAHRVSPLEIEEVVDRLAGVLESAAVPASDELLGHVVHVRVVLDPAAEAPPDAAAVQRHCREHLALYKVPKRVDFVSSLPKTASGKLMRHALVDPQEPKT